MAIDLYPISFSTLVERLQREMNGESMYALPRRSWWTPDPDISLEFDHFGMKLGTPVGPASGPHTQLAQNLVLSWLGGSRFMELKTVQILDELEIPRPCIHVPHIGYNVEWSQELLVHQSAAEYAKGWYLLHLLASDKGPGLWPSMDAVFDISVGYDLKGIQSEKVAGYLQTMKNARDLLDSLRDSLPPSLREFADIEVPAEISNSVTISTFHGCPADEIEAIASHLLEEYGFHTVVKLNPTLLGFERVQDIVRERLGYKQIHLSPEPFEKDLKWDQMLDMLPRLQKIADDKGVGFGVKFSNTLVMQSEEPPFTLGEEMYLSGPPLHVLALTLASEFAEATDFSIPITFSAGVDASNFPGLVSAGLGPITTCSDLLKARGYGRLHKYLRNLEKDIKAAGHTALKDYLGSASQGSGSRKESLPQLQKLASETVENPAFHSAKNSKAPKKVGSDLVLFDCLTCDKCIPVCPNAANFSFPVEKATYNPGRVSWKEGSLETSEGQPLLVDRKHQIGNTVEACNLCGHCDTWCPEDGGPYLVKPNLFLSPQSFDDHPERDGFLLGAERSSIRWRRQGKIYGYEVQGDNTARFETPEGSSLILKDDQPVSGEGEGDVDLRVAVSMRLILAGLTHPEANTWLPSQG